MKIIKKVSKRNFSLIDITLYVILCPLVIGMLSSLFIYTHNTVKSINYNTKVYSDIDFYINSLNNDLQNAYYIDVNEDKIYLKNSDGKKVYYFNKDKGILLINDFNALNITDFEIKELTSDDNVFPLYEISITTNLKNNNYKDYPYSISSKFVCYERK